MPFDGAYFLPSSHSQETEVARVSLSATPFSINRDFIFPLHYPVLSPSLASHLSPVEWASLLSSLNASLSYPPSYLLLHSVCLLLCLGTLAVNWAVDWGWEEQWVGWLRWSLLVGLLLGWWALARRLREAAYQRMQRRLKAGSAELEAAEPSTRQGRLPCVLRLTGEGQVSVGAAVRAGGGRHASQADADALCVWVRVRCSCWSVPLLATLLPLGSSRWLSRPERSHDGLVRGCQLR